MVHMPGELQGKDHKLARPFHGPFRVLKMTPSNAEVVLVDKPRDPSIFVALNRVRLCYPEQSDETWTGPRKRRKRRGKKKVTFAPDVQPACPRTGPVTRSQTRNVC